MGCLKEPFKERKEGRLLGAKTTEIKDPGRSLQPILLSRSQADGKDTRSSPLKVCSAGTRQRHRGGLCLGPKFSDSRMAGIATLLKLALCFPF
jgi:hypothetical protein